MQDTYNLERFLRAQEHDFATALTEIRKGRKQSHWIWYIFPQLADLGSSETAVYYGITCLDEAVEYLKNQTLKEHLIEISEALYQLDGSIS